MIIKKVLKDKVKKIYEDLNEEIENTLEKVGLEKSIITLLKDDNIKMILNKLYINLSKLNLSLITLEDYNYILKYDWRRMEVPFCIIINKNVNLNNKNILMYYSDYYSKSAIYTLKFLSKIIKQNSGNSISYYESENITSIKIISYENILEIDSKNIILSNKKYTLFFLLMFVDYFIIIEARFENKIQSLVDLFLESGKEIYIVPSNIFNKNSYFSNYLIKQGANIIVNVNDLKLILKGNIR